MVEIDLAHSINIIRLAKHLSVVNPADGDMKCMK